MTSAPATVAYLFRSTCSQAHALDSLISQPRSKLTDRGPPLNTCRSLSQLLVCLGSSSANKNAPTLDATGCSNGEHLDAAGVDGEVVMEGRGIKIAMDWAEIGEVGTAAGHGIGALATRRCYVRYATQRSNECCNDSNPDGARHILIPEI